MNLRKAVAAAYSFVFVAKEFFTEMATLKKIAELLRIGFIQFPKYFVVFGFLVQVSSQFLKDTVCFLGDVILNLGKLYLLALLLVFFLLLCFFDGTLPLLLLLVYHLLKLLFLQHLFSLFLLADSSWSNLHSQ